MSMTALEGVRVLDLTHYIAGPHCTKLLADYGAGVIKVERPGTGDPARSLGPFYQDRPHLEGSGLFLHLNTNKRGITLNLKSAEGKDIVRRLAQKSDILVENFSPGVTEGLGLDYQSLAPSNPRLVYTSISNFGQTGPYRDLRASEIVSFAMGGPMNVTGHPEREPLKLGGNVVAYHAGTVAAYAAMLALYTAEDTGEGQQVDVSVYETQTGFRDRRVAYLTAYAYTGEIGERPHPELRLGSGTRPCADGYVNITAMGHRFSELCDMIGHPELVRDQRFSSLVARMQPEAGEAFDEYYLPWLMSHSMRDAVAESQAHHLLAGPINSVKDIMKDAHFQGRGLWETIDHPHTGPLLYPGRPFVMGETPRSPAQRAPLLGEHTVQVLREELGYTQEEVLLLRQQGVI
jgi:crotonobetainyl-CoA:carnitine CoA-transferase CaiB-like acyl-CoA transferase